jgi:hypothetical protein
MKNNQLKQKRMTVVIATAIITLISTAACYWPYAPDCPGLPANTWCPDGAIEIATCQTDNKLQINQMSGSGSGFSGLLPTNSICRYTCHYVDGNGKQVGCGSITNTLSGSIPDPNSPPCTGGSGSGSGTGGGS